jgi:hypothetical protein
MKYMNVLMISMTLLGLFGTIAAADPSNINIALGSFCGTLKGALAVGMMLLIVLAAIIYAVGQVMGAETRARASVWATAMFVGALVGALIYIIMPYILSLLMTGSPNTDWVNTCCSTSPGEACLPLNTV